MPKVNYTSAKGLFQNAGTGIDLTDSTADVAKRRGVISLTNAAALVTRSLLSTESGSVIFINPGSSSQPRAITISLPTASAGLYYTFIVTADSGHSNNDVFIKTAAASSDFIGLILMEENSNDNIKAMGATTSTIKLDAGTALTMGHSRIEVVCDGTDWLITEAVVPVASNSAMVTLANGI